MENDNYKIISVYSVLCFVWGSTWLAIRISLESITPLVSAGYRFVLASVLILILVKIRKIKIQRDKISILLYLYMAFFSFVIPFGLVYWAEQYVASGLAAILFGVYPFFVAIFSYLFIPSEKIGTNKIAGMILGFAGIIVIFSDDFSGNSSFFILGMIAIFVSAVIQSTVAVAIKKYGHHLNPLSMNFLPMIIAGAVMLLIGYSAEDTTKLTFELPGILAVIYLAIFGSIVTFTSYYWLLKRINIVILSLIAFITPVVALLLGNIFYNEILSLQHYTGSAMVLAGLIIANLAVLKKVKNVNISEQET